MSDTKEKKKPSIQKRKWITSWVNSFKEAPSNLTQNLGAWAAIITGIASLLIAIWAINLSYRQINDERQLNAITSLVDSMHSEIKATSGVMLRLDNQIVSTNKTVSKLDTEINSTNNVVKQMETEIRTTNEVVISLRSEIQATDSLTALTRAQNSKIDSQSEIMYRDSKSLIEQIEATTKLFIQHKAEIDAKDRIDSLYFRTALGSIIGTMVVCLGTCEMHFEGESLTPKDVHYMKRVYDEIQYISSELDKNAYNPFLTRNLTSFDVWNSVNLGIDYDAGDAYSDVLLKLKNKDYMTCSLKDRAAFLKELKRQFKPFFNHFVKQTKNKLLEIRVEPYLN